MLEEDGCPTGIGWGMTKEVIGAGAGAGAGADIEAEVTES